MEDLSLTRPPRTCHLQVPSGPLWCLRSQKVEISSRAARHFCPTTDKYPHRKLLMESCGRAVCGATTRRQTAICRPRHQARGKRVRAEITDITGQTGLTRAPRAKQTANTDPRNTETSPRITRTRAEAPGPGPTVQRAAPRVTRENRTTWP